MSLDLRISEYNFKTLSPEQVKTLVADVQSRPQHERVIDLDRVLTYVSESPLQVRTLRVSRPIRQRYSGRKRPQF